MAYLVASWERAGAGDLSNFTSNWLRTAGPDALLLDRQAGAIVKTPPTEHPAKRAHTVQVATVEPAVEWERAAVTIAEPATPLQIGPETGVLIDPDQDTWALPLPAPVSVTAYKTTMAKTTDPMLRSSLWHTVRHGLHNALIPPADVLDVASDALDRKSAGWGKEVC